MSASKAIWWQVSSGRGRLRKAEVRQKTPGVLKKGRQQRLGNLPLYITFTITRLGLETIAMRQLERERITKFWAVGGGGCRGNDDNLHSSVQRSVVSDSLRPHGLQQARLPCPSPTPSACSNSCPTSQRCHPTISSSVVPFSSCLQSSPASGSFPVSQFFTSGGQSIGALTSASVPPMNIQDWFPLGLTGLISLSVWYYNSFCWHLLYLAKELSFFFFF